MTRKTVLVAGATGLVGYAALKHFRTEPDTDVIAVSRRVPHDLRGATHVAVDLTDPNACAQLADLLTNVTHLVYAALYELPGLVDGWRNQAQIETNDRMLRNLLEPLARAAVNLRHVTLLQGTKAYGVHVRPLTVPAREGRSELRAQPNFYWNQEDYLRTRQRDAAWHFTILRPVLIVGEAIGGAMNLIPALGVHAALLREQGQALPYPGGAARVGQAVDADLLARAIAWAGRTEAARNETFNVTNGDVFVWENIWPAIAEAMGMDGTARRPFSLRGHLAPAGIAAWDAIRTRHGLSSPGLEAFVGLSLEYADYQMRHGQDAPGPPAIVSTIRIMQAGFTEVMDTEAMFRKWFGVYQDRSWLPKPTGG
jgi:nucleoside-diphosphate-sugar epimerase